MGKSSSSPVQTGQMERSHGEWFSWFWWLWDSLFIWLGLNEPSQKNRELSLKLEQKHKELREILQRMDHMEETHRSVLEHKEAEHREKIHVLEKDQEERLRFAELKEKDLTERLNQLNLEKQQLRKCERSSCQRCEHQAQEHRQQMCEMEKFYKDKLTVARSALKEKDEQFSSFKDRVAENMVLSLKTDNTENMNSPVNQSRLTEMYQQLRVCTWPNIQFPRSDREARTLVQEMFAAAAEHMKRPLDTVEKVCGVKASSPKVEKFRQTALENLQLALYHSSKQDVFQVVFPHFDGGAAEVELASECYWLGCLMALHVPPLHPHWDRADEERRTVFPRDIRSQALNVK
ncbi:uncharacterized protein LOC117389074 [Periophthalmus magnuspinnatus]|uniref:uncharacterized protein LOC117389074 n=1 Tax=Periophthalmus magnuspinnatus TaxID=409849 RepID=UPI00243683C6|nr:uncharacterized protein LOC117389074 [Periophthalmus magnuspinnatus]